MQDRSRLSPRRRFAGALSFSFLLFALGLLSPALAWAQIVVSPASLPTLTAGNPFNQTLASTGGTGPYTYSVDAGALPVGLSLSPAGIISGTPTRRGSYNFSVRSQDSLGDFVSRSYTGVVENPSFEITPTTGTAIRGVAFSQTLSATGGVAPHSFLLESGSFPAGISISAAGVISGTATAAGTYSVTLRVTDASTGSGSWSELEGYTLTVTFPPTIVVSPATVPAATVGATYSQTFTASGGTGPYSFAISAGGLPAGLTLDAGSGALTGTPTAGGTFNFTVRATDSDSFTGSRAYSLTAAAPTIVLPPTTLPNATIGAAYSTTLNAASGGTAPYSYALSAGALPAGVMLSSAGVLSGTPTADGTFNFSVTATDSSTGTGPYSATQSYSLQSDTVPPVANAVSATVAYGAAAAPITLNITGGAASSVAVSTAAAHGTATAGGTTITYQPTAGYAGPDTFTYTATNAAGTSAPATVTITVSTPTLTITPSAVLTVPVGTAYTQTFTFAGGAAPYSGYSVTGLPAGLSITGTTADSVTVSGTPTAAGAFSLNVSATDSSTGTGPFAHGQVFSLTVSAPTMSISPAPGTLALTYGAAFSQTFTASGGVAPYSYSLAAGSLPPGMSFTSAGVLSGTPTMPGDYAITIQGTDSSTGTGAPFTVQANYLLQVGAAGIAINPSTLPDGAVGTPYSQALAATGGVGPYSYSLLSGALPVGMSFSSAGQFAGIPRSAGTFSLNVRATDANGQTGTQAFTFDIAAPTLTIVPATLPAGLPGAVYSQALSTSGGVAPYSYSLLSGALPIGLSFSSAGVLSGTPTTAGSYTFQVRSTDADGFSATVSYTVVIAAPTITIAPGSLPAGVRGSAYTQTLTASGGMAPYTFALTGGTLPPGMSLGSNGVLSGTPAADGDFSFTVAATDANGFSGTMNFVWTVDAAASLAVDDVATMLSGSTTTIAVTENDTGVIASVAITSAPTHGTAAVSGLEVVYTPAEGFSGTDSFSYIATGPGGSSAPATVTVTVNPLPVAVSRTVDVQGVAAVDVDLTEGATGGPFTAATLVSLAPAQAGSATIARSGEGGSARYILTFTPAAGFSGIATARFTLANAFATSAEASIEFHVVGRPDPSQDPEVLGLLRAQAEATRRFATAQIDNFQRRLESLHGGGGGRFDNGVSFQIDPRCRQAADSIPDQHCDRETSEAERDEPVATATNPQEAGGAFGLWTGGVIRSGQLEGSTARAKVDFESDGLSVGGDYRLTPDFVIGAGLGWGRDDSDIGALGSRSEGTAYTLAAYASYHPGRFFLDALAGYQNLSYDLRRYVTANGALVGGSRDGGQWFASLSAGADVQRGPWQLTPYARLDVARAILDGYTERGDPFYALRYVDMDVDTTTGNLGLRFDYRQQMSWGVLTPQFRLEYQYDFQGGGSASMSYADLLSGPFYRADVQGLDHSRFQLGLGAQFSTDNGLSTRIEYRGVLGDGRDSDHGVLLNVEKKY
ncbi:putative Ig domain-containing protein [Pseudoxanthomonas sp. CF125]|uniref:putative Ig domain-containing protein n=1 Tax=Pseudoxanthomonas sp. CF125 TaxID=1855303 RepID=UPI00087F91C4|nr:putative Ig domain-containing protein [Pseudoxanthomonas sp. CF125]SDQ35237.1 Uncharacterized protein YhjY, contains autotransporter beta-barrel domain [Pseudoxanthomonas sp. CF125]